MHALGEQGSDCSHRSSRVGKVGYLQDGLWGGPWRYWRGTLRPPSEHFPLSRMARAAGRVWPSLKTLAMPSRMNPDDARARLNSLPVHDQHLDALALSLAAQDELPGYGAVLLNLLGLADDLDVGGRGKLIVHHGPQGDTLDLLELRQAGGVRGQQRSQIALLGRG